MQRTHIPEETKCRCEYCPFSSEEKKAMLDHMMFAHEMDDGSVNTDVNATDTNYGNEQLDESASNSIDDDDEEETQGIDENGSSDDVTANMAMLDVGSDDMNTTTNIQVSFDHSDENIVEVEEVKSKPDFVHNDSRSTIETPSTPSNSFDKSSFSSTAAKDKLTYVVVNLEHDGGEERNEDEYFADENILVGAGEIIEPTSVKTIKARLAPNSSAASSEGDTPTVSHTEIEVFECNKCWYYSTKGRDLLAHKQLHVKRGALFNCTECVFNVTKLDILYHHYRYGHMIDEPESRYPEISVVRAGQRDMIEKNVIDKLGNRTSIVNNIYKHSGPPIVWNYSKENSPPFLKVFKCRYCPYTNRRRYILVEHESMHWDHPKNHKRMQQQLSGDSVLSSSIHACKLCTYVCNHGGTLALHGKVHSTSYRCSTVGFYDTSISNMNQIWALEYVMELEQSLLLDKNTATNSGISHSANDVLSDSSSDNESQEDVAKYTEIDNLELIFCPYCPARYFFLSDLRFHIRFHRFRGWKNACDCCSFVARSESLVAEHELVHRDEYAQRTTELLASGYPVNPKYPRPSEYPASVSDEFVDNDEGSAIETISTTYKNFEKIRFNIITADDVVTENVISCKYDVGEEQFEDDQVEDEVNVVSAEKVTEPTSVKTMKGLSLSSPQLSNYKDSKTRMPEPENEISVQQTTYDVNGAIGNLVGKTKTSIFRCVHCPFECDIGSKLDQHNRHHLVVNITSEAACSRSQKLSCGFCTYHTNCEVDLAYHIPVHFLRSTGKQVSANEEYMTDETYVSPTPTDVGVGDHIELHDKRVM